MKVLIVTPEPVTRALLDSAVRAGGCQPIACKSGQDAVREVAKPDGPALLILDRNLPGEDALEVCRALRADPRGARAFVALLAPGQKSEVQLIHARSVGAEVLFRPVDVKAVHRWLTRGRVVSGALRASDPNLRRWDEGLVGRTIEDKYLVLGLLGSGGMGAVYKVRHLLVDELLAFKVIHADLAARPRFRERFAREAKTMLRVVHPHAVAVRDCGETQDGLLYLTMDLMSGRTLRDVVDESGALPEARAIRVTEQIAGALTAAHDKGVVHRDLKPDNVLLERNDQVRVCDFGLAKLLEDSDIHEVTGTGMVLGTPHYMAPEQASGRVEDGRSDVYALGCMLYELLCGSPPFQGRSAYQLLQAHVIQSPLPFAQRGVRVSPRLEALVMRMLAKQLADRPSAAQVAEALGALAARHTPEKSLRVLVADDSAVNRALLGGMLRGWGHQVVLARDGEEAVTLAVAPGAAFDAIILDGEMPQLDGPAAARRLRQLEGAAARIPILGMTASEGQVDRGRCLAAGMDEVVQKPIRPEQLGAALEHVTMAALPGAASEDSDVFDRHAALERVEGDAELLRETLTLLLDDMQRIDLALRGAAVRRDADGLARAAHELKGAAGNCAAISLARAAARVESLARGGMLEKAAEELTALSREVERAIPVLQRVARGSGMLRRLSPVA